MCGSRCLILAATLALAVGLPGCNRDYKAPKPRTGIVDSVTLSAASSDGHTGSGGKEDS
jgi:hypothetical protein